jgi:uncharacterized flavoprotein (TIGR03862 family)
VSARSASFVAVVGGGPAGLAAAEVLAGAGHRVTVIEQMPSVGRKLLLAGRSGLNLTNAEPLDDLLERYGRARRHLEPSIRDFPPDDVRSWAAGLGEATSVGSSGRVFPASWRATALLRAWLRRLDDLGVELAVHHRWDGWNADGALRLRAVDGDSVIRPEATVLALGGASWPRTGSDGRWVPQLVDAGVEVRPLRPANSGFDVAWSAAFRERFAGQPLKNLRVNHGVSTARGEAVVTGYGVESGVFYAVGATLRDTIEREGHAIVVLDLHPDRSRSDVARLLATRRAGDSTSAWLRRRLGLTPVTTGLLRESTGNRLPSDPAQMAALVKAAPLRLVGVQPLARAISTSGGVAFGAVDDSSMLLARPGVFVAGEMLDWDAPTGGYLLQACVSTGRAAAAGALRWLQR